MINIVYLFQLGLKCYAKIQYHLDFNCIVLPFNDTYLGRYGKQYLQLLESYSRASSRVCQTVVCAKVLFHMLFFRLNLHLFHLKPKGSSTTAFAHVFS